MSPANSHKFFGLMLAFPLFFAPLPSLAQYSRQDCQSEITRMREIYIVILKKIPAMPPLAQLSSGIQRALNDAEMSRDAGDFKSCVTNMRNQISIVQSYAR